MIQDIHPHLFNNTFVVTTGIQENDHVFYFKENSLLLKQKGEVFEIPTKKELGEFGTEGLFLFTLNEINCYLVWDCPEQDTADFTYQDIKFLKNIFPQLIDWVSGVALQLKNWYVQNKFCGKCGSATEFKNNERAIVCPACENLIYPSISPAIIVAIFCQDKILLARGAAFPDGFYSLVAGYVDVGETVEEAVIREVKEEVGLNIKNIRYYKSQPWPFSGSMMIGFIAEAEDEQIIKADGIEIVDAAWFSRDNLPVHPSDRSIAGEIIEKFKNKETF